MTDPSIDYDIQRDFVREAKSTVAFLLSAFEEVEHEAPWFQQAFKKGKEFLKDWENHR